MKEKGFTLIELLAVIVILAIIALIAVPIILNIIEDAKKESNERSVELYASAVKNGIASHQLRTGNEVTPGSYNSSNLPITVDYEGNVECEVIEIYADGNIYLEGCIVNGGEETYDYGEKPEPLCTAIEPIEQGLYYDPDSRVYSEIVGVQATTTEPYAIGAVYSCNLGDGERVFYVIKEEGSDVKLIMSENLGDSVEQNLAETVLADRTSGWTKIDQSKITMLKSQDITSSSNIYHINLEHMDFGDGSFPDGYWLLSEEAYVVSCDGLCKCSVGDFGVRPVITISKSLLSLSNN